MDKRILIGIICLLTVASCAVKNEFITKHRKKTIRLTSIAMQVKIGYETEKAIIYLSKNDAIELTKNLLSSKNLDPRFDKLTITELQYNLDTLKKINNNINVKHWLAEQSNFNLNDYNFAGFIDQWLIRDLILKGKVEILNKTTGEFETKIVYHKVTDRLGGKDSYYTFKNGTEFHRQLIALGE